jgi:hypothetical protein
MPIPPPSGIQFCKSSRFYPRLFEVVTAQYEDFVSCQYSFDELTFLANRRHLLRGV